MRARRLRADEKGNASFAFVAVAILLAVTAMSALVAQNEKMNRDFAASSREAELAGEIKRLITSEADLVLQAVTMKILGFEEGSFDLENFRGAIRAGVIEHFSDVYPAYIETLRVNVTVLNVTASVLAFTEVGSTGVAVPGSISVSVNLVISANSDDISFQMPLDITKEIRTPVPYLDSRLSHIDRCAKTEGSLGRIAKSILSQLVQLRVIQGFGAAGHPEARGLEDIIGVEDVEFAVNLALQLTVMSDLSTIDPSAWSELMNRTPTGLSDAPVQEYIESGEIDPFRLFLRLRQSMGSATTVNLQDFAAQAMFSTVDRLVLRYLEYTNLIDLADLALVAGGTIVNGWRDIVECLTGVDVDLEQAQDWIAGEFSDLDIPVEMWDRIFASSDDISLEANQTIVYIFDRQGALMPVMIRSAPITLDIPPLSIIESDSWKEFYISIRPETIRIGEFAQSALADLCVNLVRCVPREEISMCEGANDSAILDLLRGIRGRIERFDLSSVSYYGDSGDIIQSDALLIALRDFIEESWTDIFPLNDALAKAHRLLAEGLADNAIVDDPGLLPLNWREQVISAILRELDGGVLEEWNATLRDEILRHSCLCRGIILYIVERAAIEPEYRDATFVGDLMDWLAEGIPSEIVMISIMRTIGQMEHQLSNFTREFSLYETVDIDLHESIDLVPDLGDELMGVAFGSLSVTPEISMTPSYLEAMEIPGDAPYSVENIEPTGRLCISITSPASGSGEGVRSVHYTRPSEFDSFPYETNWVVRVIGITEMSIRDSLDWAALTTEDILIDLEIPITALSGWALEDVCYESSNTLAGDALALLIDVKDRLWRFFSPLIEILQEALDFLADGVSELWRYVTGFAERLGSLFLEFGNLVVRACAELVERIRSSPLWDLLEIRLELLGKVETVFSYGPVNVIVTLSLPDLLFRKAKDLIRVIIVTELDSMNVAFGFRIAKLSNGAIDVVANSTIRWDSLRIDMRADPLMLIRDYLFEIEGRWNGLRLQIWSPEINDYRQLSLQLSDIPGLGALLSSISIPELGISISLNAGMIMKYRLPIADQIVINEVELNPRGPDSGNEWVELYNPLSRDVSLSDFKLETMHGDICVIDLDGTIPAKGYRVFIFSKRSLDNGDPRDSFARGDSILLRDVGGRIIDLTPLISDSANDGNTWKRSWDGSPRWVFGPGSMGTTNGNPLIYTYPDLLAKLCVDSLFAAFEKERENVSASLGFVRNLFGSFLRELILQTASFAASLVHEVVLFVDIGVNDLSGTVGSGLRIRVSIDGELLRQGILWFIENLIQLFGNLLWNKSMTPDLLRGSHPAEAIFLGFDTYARVGTPNLMRAIFVGDSIPTEVKIAFSVSLNLATIGWLLGKSWGESQLIFGIHIDDLPGLTLVPPLSTRCDHIDLWLVRGRIYPA